MYLVDAQGRRYLDACGGAAVSCLGHGHPEVLAAMHRQIDQLAYAHTSFFLTEVAETLADQLVRTAPPGMSHVYFVSGGSEAMEAAMKLARQYFVETGEPERRHFIARKQSYHGNTLGVLAVGGNAWRRAPFARCWSRRPMCRPAIPTGSSVATKPQSSTAAPGTGVGRNHYTAGAEGVIAFVAETVGGATAGVLVPVPGYFRAVREV